MDQLSERIVVWMEFGHEDFEHNLLDSQRLQAERMRKRIEFEFAGPVAAADVAVVAVVGRFVDVVAVIAVAGAVADVGEEVVALVAVVVVCDGVVAEVACEVAVAVVGEDVAAVVCEVVVAGLEERKLLCMLMSSYCEAEGSSYVNTRYLVDIVVAIEDENRTSRPENETKSEMIRDIDSLTVEETTEDDRPLLEFEQTEQICTAEQCWMALESAHPIHKNCPSVLTRIAAQ